MDILGFIPAFGNVAFTIIVFIIALSVIVAIHEYGHYIVGRWTGIHAEVFSLGFGPVLWSRHDRHGTKWQVAALPFGGYVKFLGDANAASAGTDEDAVAGLSDEELRHTMHGAPLWARSATVAAGPIFNFVLSILVFAGIFMIAGKPVETVTIGELRKTPIAESGLKVGDEVLFINETEVQDWGAFGTALTTLPDEGPFMYTVRREGTVIEVPGAHPFPPIVEAYQPRSAALAAGIEIGDVITAVDGQAISSFAQLVDVVRGSAGRELQMQIWREGESLTLPMTPRVKDTPLAEGGFEQRYMIGISGGTLFEPATESVGLVESILGGAERTWTVITTSLTGLYYIATGGISACNISGPVGIAQSAGVMADHGLTDFIWFIAVLSTAIGMLNLFPIPVLDGGHLVFHAYEAATGRAPSEGALKVMMTIGLALLLGLMAFALTNDVTCT